MNPGPGSDIAAPWADSLCGSGFDRLERQSDVVELRLIDRRWRLQHQIAAALILRERHDLADVVLIAEEHHQPVETERDAAMGWRTVLQRVEQRPKPLGQLIAGVPHQAEHFFLIGALVQADAATTDFEAVQR